METDEKTCQLAENKIKNESQTLISFENKFKKHLNDKSSKNSNPNAYGIPKNMLVTINSHKSKNNVDNILSKIHKQVVPVNVVNVIDINSIIANISKQIGKKFVLQRIRNGDNRIQMNINSIAIGADVDIEKQLNKAQLSNKKLQRENERLRNEIKDSRDAQANALKQSSDALQQIQPLRLENTQLKQAITEWKNLIQTKDSEFEDLVGECDDLRAANEQYRNEYRDAIEQLEELKFGVKSLTF